MDEIMHKFGAPSDVQPVVRRTRLLAKGEKYGFGGEWRFPLLERGAIAVFELPPRWDLCCADLVLQWLDLIKDQIEDMMTNPNTSFDAERGV